MKNRLFFSLFSLFLTITASMPALAGDLVVTRYFSGLWEQPQHESQGLVLQIIDQEDADGDPKAVAYWFTYGDDQQSAWYIAIGEVEGDQVVMDLYATSGVDFLQPASAEFDPVERIGMLTLTFMNCNKGTASYALEADGGSEETFEIRRLAALYNSRCSGGISDNTPASAKPLMLQVDLLPPEDGADGKGKAKFWERSDRSDFHVSVEAMPAGGAHDLLLGCVDEDFFYEGVLYVEDGEGSVQFRSPEFKDKRLLTQDPRDCRIDVLQGGKLYLTSGENVLAPPARGPEDDGDDDDDSSVKVIVEFDNGGFYESATGSAHYKVDDEGENTLFSVRVQGLPGGEYTVFVDDEDWGVLKVPNENARAVLNVPDVDGPWGAVIEVVDSEDNTLLSAAFPDSG
jgi:hypothetical protein